MKHSLATIFSILTFSALHAQQPIDKVKAVADRVILNTPFQYQYTFYKPGKNVNYIQVINFGRNFGVERNALACAYTTIQVPQKDTSAHFVISYTDAVEVYLNEELIFSNYLPHALKIIHAERSNDLERKITVRLHKGTNNLVIKSAITNKSKEWSVLWQIEENVGNTSVAPNAFWKSEVLEGTNFVLLGAYPINTLANLKKFSAPKDYLNLNNVITFNQTTNHFSIPRKELTPVVMNPQPYWGSYYNYNYHTAGVAWSMQHLATATKDKRYDAFAANYCDFMLQSIPVINYYKNELFQFDVTNYFLINTPLLDFTAAPCLPFANRLYKEKSFNNSKQYDSFFTAIKNYVVKNQIRMPGTNFTRKTPEVYTTWVDDMFMGLAFLVQASNTVTTATERNALITDAAKQVIAFNKLLFDEKDSLYHHVFHSQRPEVKYPYWLRANGWGIWAATEVLKNLPVTHPLYKDVLSIYQKHVLPLMKHQDASGFWHNVINKPETRLETSGSAIFTMAIARGVNNGWIDVKYKSNALKGWKALESRIEADGTVHGIIVGSMTGEDYHYYESLAMVDNDSHGLFCVMECGIEIQKMIDKK
jgi:rhamnogalacturonyl hydrolase YesR